MAVTVPRIIGHRGARATAPENTLAGIRQGRREGATWVEFDVKLTADGVPVLIHDEMLDRTTNGKGPVRDATYAEIQKLDAGGWFGPQFAGEKLPTLKEALDLMGELGMGFNLEIKPCPGREAETARVCMAEVAKHWPSSRPAPIISSFRAQALEAARAAAPDRLFGYLIEQLPPNWADEAKRLGCAYVHADTRSLTREQARAVKDRGLTLIVWTVNDAARGRELLSWGADALITDRPAGLAAELG